MFLTDSDFAGVAVSAILGGSPLGLPPLAQPPPPPARPRPLPPSCPSKRKCFLGLPLAPPPHRLPARPSKIREKVFLSDSELCGRCRLSDFGRIFPRPPPSSPPPPVSSHRLPGPPPSHPSRSPSFALAKFKRKCFLQDSELCGRCRLSDFGRISPRPPPSRPPPPRIPPLLPSPLSRPSRIQECFLWIQTGNCRFSNFGDLC